MAIYADPATGAILVNADGTVFDTDDETLEACCCEEAEEYDFESWPAELTLTFSGLPSYSDPCVGSEYTSLTGSFTLDKDSSDPENCTPNSYGYVGYDLPIAGGYLYLSRDCSGGTGYWRPVIFLNWQGYVTVAGYAIACDGDGKPSAGSYSVSLAAVKPGSSCSTDTSPGNITVTIAYD